MRRILVRDLAGHVLGSVSVLGTTRVAEMDAMQRAADLAARQLGHPWAVAWQVFGTDGGPIGISVSDGWNAGRTVARWAFYECEAMA